MPIADYLNFITSEHRDKPKFIEELSIWLNYCQDIENLFNEMNLLYDINNAYGNQLDIIGQRIGIKRYVSFSSSDMFDSILDGGTSSSNPSNVVDGGDSSENYETIIDGGTSGSVLNSSLNDNDYRVLIKAQIFKNYWKGTTATIYDLWKSLFPDKSLIIRDNQNMTMDVIAIGFNSGNQTNLLKNGYIIPKPQGVGVNFYSATLPIFGFGRDDDNISGFGKGRWIGFN